MKKSFKKYRNYKKEINGVILNKNVCLFRGDIQMRGLPHDTGFSRVQEDICRELKNSLKAGIS